MPEQNWKKNPDGSFTEVKPTVDTKKKEKLLRVEPSMRFTQGSLGFSKQNYSRIDALRLKKMELKK